MTKHTDFTKFEITSGEDGSTITITRLETPRKCEACSSPAEYRLDSNAGSQFIECQSCLELDRESPYHSDVFNLIES